MDIHRTKIFDSIISFVEKGYYFFLAIIMAMTIYNVFHNLGLSPIESFDEARHGVNAYEMIKNNNYIVSTYGYKNDYWNLKPPVSYWTIIAGYKAAGFNELGLRAASACAAVLTILILALFMSYKYDKLSALISAIVLSTTTQYITEHCARTGDADSVFVLFFTISMICLSLSSKSLRWLYVSGVAFSLAFLTKSFHALNIILIICMYLILSKDIFRMKFVQIILVIVNSFFLIAIWGFYRYKQDGLKFFQAMINYDLLARTSSTVEKHGGDSYFYLDKISSSYFHWIIVLFAVVAANVLLLKHRREKEQLIDKSLVLILWITVPLILYSLAKTKIQWYIIPVYPALAVVIGAGASSYLKCRYRNLISQLFLTFLILHSAYRSENYILNVISKTWTDPGQIVLKELKSYPQYTGKNIYTTFFGYSAEDPYRFRQNYLLSAELYDDLIPLEGGFEGFLNDKTNNPIILLKKDKNILAQKEKYRLKILLEYDDAVILTKEK
ncbi:glycosyltransferase family 39 protein [Clostridium sp. YIM B02515]|uniref:Glycosyltransferase family 39 protein n=1 Tax=Clostridium rhizosphaerae TaxID=2803861 RepID=A0ABS1TBX7_9CLOT|nr:glycosyltransferase family 39 protein [Clostridium rhizosphaerae]MBL4936869.1 glycosyltransferase family 39 protein [Clostridium rhizosphaerae]